MGTNAADPKLTTGSSRDAADGRHRRCATGPQTPARPAFAAPARLLRRRRRASGGRQQPRQCGAVTPTLGSGHPGGCLVTPGLTTILAFVRRARQGTVVLARPFRWHSDLLLRGEIQARLVLVQR